MIVTTTDGVEGRSISAYCGIVSGEAVMEAVAEAIGVGVHS